VKPWLLVLVIAAGVGVGRLLAGAHVTAGDLIAPLTDVVLYTLMGLVGILLGADRAAFEALRRAGLRFLLVPLAITVGTLLGGLAMAPLSGLPVGQTLAVAGGLGWYSLSGVLLAGMGYAAAGATAVLANILRELLALIFIPTIARRLHPLQTLAPAGATATDVTLPIILASAGADMAMLAVASGGLLSALVPFLVPLLAGLGT
jgi:uncharacterized membrane protein YbjE (DUF340 family)